MTTATTLWAIAAPCLTLFAILGIIAEAYAHAATHRHRNAQRSHRKAAEAHKAHCSMFLPKNLQGRS